MEFSKTNYRLPKIMIKKYFKLSLLPLINLPCQNQKNNLDIKRGKNKIIFKDKH